MKITHFVPAHFPIRGYGGTERAAYWLGLAQAEMGHEVTYICQAGSSLPFARCVPYTHGFTDLDPYVPTDCDIVHIYGSPQFKISYPFLVTIEGNGAAGEKFLPNTVFVSANHAKRHGWTEFVYNGINLGEYPLNPKPREASLLFLAKASWSIKNLAGCLQIAKNVHRPLHVAGGRLPFWKRGAVSYGIIDGQKKLALLQSLRTLLYPVLWDEPFGIAVIEALACGMPVVATPRGSLPELLDATCGVLANSFDDLCAAVHTADTLDPAACRARVETHFTHRHMANKYLSYYQKILRDGRLREGQPQVAPDFNPSQKILYAGSP